jgi:formylglycine-generating enzyme required for sulfatase activity
MICPYCAEDVPADSQQHHGCRRIRDKQFPPFYLDHDGGDAAAEPVVLSVVGFSGHGKTVYLCALFDYLDNHLTYMWPNFFNHVLDQESLSRLNDNRRKLRAGELPPRTAENFPRPGIFRLTNMPGSVGGNGLPSLKDTTVLIYDPPGEAFVTEDKIVEFASFVKRSSCVLFLIDITALGDSIADEMARLLDTYVLGMRRMGIAKKSQHLIVVYTKSDEMKVSVPEFAGFLEQEPKLRDHLDQQRPETLTDPHAHFRQLEDISRLLEAFTWSELSAGRFIHVARDWFASVSYTVVSSLGAAPEKVQDGNGDAAAVTHEDDNAPLDLGAGNGHAAARLTVKMSPRGVADPLLYVLAKSIKEPPPPPLPPPDNEWPVWLLPALIGGAALLLILFIALLAWAWSGTDSNRNVPANKAANANTNTPATNANTPGMHVTAPKGMAYVPGGEFVMGSASGDDFERPPHRVAVKPFFIDRYEVTCADYARFVEQTGHAPPPGWHGGQYPQGAASRPVTGVSWDDAFAYAKWANKRLPTEEEWEFAARGTDGRPYPWGKEWQAGMANAGGVAGGLADVGAFKGVSPFGLYDMVGNAWEWTADDLRPYPGGQWPVIPQGALKVIRGGSWREGPGQATATYRGYLPARSSKDYSATGFRCAQDVAGEAVLSAGDGHR